jgi:endonuclease-3
MIAETPTYQDVRPDKLKALARLLDSIYGPRHWRSSGDAVDELVATILSQHTSDVNTERAFSSLKARFPSWHDVMAAPVEEVADAIRCGGLANVKAPRIQAVLASILHRYGTFDLRQLASKSVSEARAELTELPGVGPKTASCVLLFSLGLPAMPVDTHVHRVARRLGLIGATVSAEAAHEELERQLGENLADVYAFHTNAIAHGRAVCRARGPRCERCEVTEHCDFYANHGLDRAASDRAASGGR